MKIDMLVKSIIKNSTIKTQGDIVNELENRGISITQANISKIIKKIGAIKSTDDKGDVFYTIPEKPIKVGSWMSEFINSIDSNEHIIVIKTHPGAANMVGQIIDEKCPKYMMGSIAGDDAIFITPDSIKNIEELKKEILDLLKFNDLKTTY